MATIQYGGYYSLEIAPGLVMISLNTQYCDSNNFWVRDGVVALRD